MLARRFVRGFAERVQTGSARTSPPVAKKGSFWADSRPTRSRPSCWQATRSLPYYVTRQGTAQPSAASRSSVSAAGSLLAHPAPRISTRATRRVPRAPTIWRGSLPMLDKSSVGLCGVLRPGSDSPRSVCRPAAWMRFKFSIRGASPRRLAKTNRQSIAQQYSASDLARAMHN
jgi:hypothetical protein